MTDTAPDGETFVASRWTKGNLLFPIRIVVNSLHVSKVKALARKVSPFSKSLQYEFRLGLYGLR
jgi:hypothetical protein